MGVWPENADPAGTGKKGSFGINNWRDQEMSHA
jgi:hypothetical protein